MKIDTPKNTHIANLQELWQEAFGDTQEFIDTFFATAFNPARCRTVTVNDEVAAALYWFNCCFADKRIAYIYAVATAQKHRGQGYCHKLMDDTHRQLEKLGYAGAILVPGSSTLFELYAGMEYKICSQIKEGSCIAGTRDIPLRRIDQYEYAALRRKMLPKNSVVQEKENLDFLQTQVNFYTGSGFLLAAQENGNGHKLRCVEFLGDESLIPSVVRTLGHTEAVYRMPGEGRYFAMYYPLSYEAVPDYFGLAFD